MFKPGYLYVHKKERSFVLFSTSNNTRIVVGSKYSGRIGEDVTRNVRFEFYDEYDSKSSVFKEQASLNSYFYKKLIEDNKIKSQTALDQVLKKAKEIFNERKNNFI